MDDTQELNTFLISWDMYGIEMCIDITEKLARANVTDKENIFELIKDPEADPPNEPMREINRYITMATLRGRMNPQRNYEMYVVKTSTDITEGDLAGFFADDPQGAADMIRDRGTKLMSHRNSERKQVIS